MNISTLSISYADYRAILDSALTALQVGYPNDNALHDLLLADCFHVLADESFSDHFSLPPGHGLIFRGILESAFILPRQSEQWSLERGGELSHILQPWMALCSPTVDAQSLHQIISEHVYLHPFAENLRWVELIDRQSMPCEVSDWRDNMLALPPGLFRLALARLYRKDVSTMPPNVASVIARFHRKTSVLLEFTMTYWMTYIRSQRTQPPPMSEDIFMADDQVRAALRMLEFASERAQSQQFASPGLLNVVRSSVSSLEQAVYREP
jgi:hypothetical protein